MTKNKITLKINHIKKYMRFVSLFALLGGCAEAPSTVQNVVPPNIDERGLVAQKPDRRVALLIGNGDYQISPLPNPVNDVDDMESALKETGFEVMKFKNASLFEMERAVQKFGRELLNKGAVGLFYFAGHGVQYQGKNFLFPIGAMRSIGVAEHLPHKTMDVNYILAAMEGAQNPLNLIFLDACRNNPFVRSLFGGRDVAVQKGLAPMQAPSGSLIAYATRPNKRALDGKGRNSPYVESLKKELVKPGIEIEQMLKNVRVAVKKATDEYQAPGYYSELDKPFCFKAPCGGSRLVAHQLVVQPPPPIYQPSYAVATASAVTPPTSLITLPPPSSKFFRDRLRDGSEGPAMVWIPGGNVQMGDIQGGGEPDEKPAHWISVSRFAMGCYEVTFAEYDKFAHATGRKKPHDSGWGRGNRPVINISWDDATAYAEWLSQQTGQQYRLPTEAEWEYAARAGTKTKYWWGNHIGANKSNCLNSSCGDSFKYTAPIGSFGSNPFGLYDMVGNVREWICSEYEEKYSGKEKQCISQKNNDSLRVIRGGAWISNPWIVRAANRESDSHNYRDYYVGFRLSRIAL
jgi:formylglycine-generating enzyme required for sulfatase activity